MNSDRNRPKAIPGEGRWVDYDEETAGWGVFGVDSGHCYSLHSDQSQANKSLAAFEATLPPKPAEDTSPVELVAV